MRRDGFRCRICGRSPASHPGVQLDIDHIVPWSKGGETAIGNLQTLCSDCNQGKAAHHEPRAGRRKKRGRRPGR
ncbi:MAG: HNH endonuclease [Planctomycetes bacterium]|nr:HNH endonuclease [Planctomycetota bacterium]